MRSLAYYLLCAFAVLGAGCRLALTRGAAGRGGRQYLVAFTGCIGLAMAVLAPATVRAADGCGWAWLPRLLPLAGAELKLAAEGFLALLALSVRPAPVAAAAAARQRLASGLVLVGCAAAYLAAGVSVHGDVLAAGRAPLTRAALVGYDTLFTLHGCWCVALFAVLVHRAARELGPGVLRRGLRLSQLGAVLGVLWAAASVIPLVEALTTGHQELAEDGSAAATAVLCLTLALAGLSLPALTASLSRPVRQLRAWRQYRRIGPLWSALHAVHPQIVLPTRTGGTRNPEFALYRRVIEIRDGHLALRAHFHPDVPAWVALAGAEQGLAAPDPALLEAAAIAAALESAAAGPDGAPAAPRAASPLPAQAPAP
ncbi:MAB_1171c family putative transporter, partial [Kitasatospora sp. LaBMicrA B282]|uniref:MAB_1171c family putative transporter n=1 Tax=Kitasatospora sp. LaBMicrA B282 TaxID=3420949 RepID=UPI003D149AF1